MLVRFTMKFSPHRQSGRPVRGQQQEVAAPRVVRLAALLLLLLLPSLAAALTLPGMDEEKARHLPMNSLPLISTKLAAHSLRRPPFLQVLRPPAGISTCR